jgi:hypothetical protein
LFMRVNFHEQRKVFRPPGSWRHRRPKSKNMHTGIVKC